MIILLVEDEIHKKDEINSCVLEVFGNLPVMVDSVSSAVLEVKSNDYDLIILDMALSTHVRKVKCWLCRAQAI